MNQRVGVLAVVNPIARACSSLSATCSARSMILKASLRIFGLDDLWIVKVPRNGGCLPDSAVSISADLTSNLSSCVSDGLSGILQATKLVKSCKQRQPLLGK